MSAWGAPESRRSSTLAWVRLPGAESCIGTVELAKAVERRLGRLVFAPVSQADLAVEGRIEPRVLGFVATLSVSDRDGKVLGTRTLESKRPDCRSMDRGLVLITSLLIDPEAFAESSVEPEPEAALEPEPPPVPVVRTSTARVSITPKDELIEAPTPLWGALTLSGSLSLGQLPGLGGGAVASLDLGLQDGLRGRISAAFAHGGTETAAGTSASFVLVSGSAGLCFARLVSRQVSLGGCGGVELGGLLAQAAELAGEQDRSALWLAAVLGLHADFVLEEHWLIHGVLELGLPLRRDRYTYLDGAGATRVLFEPSPVVVRLGLGFGFRLLGS